MTDRDARSQEALEALRTVKHPSSGRDLLDLDAVEHLTHCEGAVKAVLRVQAPSAAVKDAVARDADAALRRLSWVTDVNLDVQAETPQEEPAQEGPALRNVLAVASGKGGVGKSTVAVNLAAGLARAGSRTGLLDADVYGPSVPTMLALTGRPEVIEGEGGRRMLAPMVKHGMKVMSMGFLVEPEKPVIWRGPMLHGALRQFLNDVAWGDLDVLVIDLPPGTGDVALTMAQSISLSGAVIISTPQEVAMIDARKAVNMFKETNVPVTGIVENMSGEVFGTGGAERWARSSDIPFLGSIPLAASIREGGDAGTPAVLGEDKEAAASFMAVVKAVQQRMETQGGGRPRRKPISIKR